MSNKKIIKLQVDNSFKFRFKMFSVPFGKINNSDKFDLFLDDDLFDVNEDFFRTAFDGQVPADAYLVCSQFDYKTMCVDFVFSHHSYNESDGKEIERIVL